MNRANNSGWENTSLEPLALGRRFWARVITNIPFVFLSAIPFTTDTPVEAILALTIGPFIYLIAFYWIFGGTHRTPAGRRARQGRSDRRANLVLAVRRSHRL